MANYINNEQFTILLKDYEQTKNPRTYEKLGKCFLAIADNILCKPNFINYDHMRKEDMLSDACYYMVKYINTYDTTKNNPFAFFSQIAFNAFIQNINKFNKDREVFVPIDFIENMDSTGCLSISLSEDNERIKKNSRKKKMQSRLSSFLGDTGGE
jgi:DNA-directed RNA polymerase specialized sigma subunit